MKRVLWLATLVSSVLTTVLQVALLFEGGLLQVFALCKSRNGTVAVNKLQQVSMQYKFLYLGLVIVCTVTWICFIEYIMV